MSSNKLKDQQKAQICIRVAEADKKLIDGADEMLQLLDVMSFASTVVSKWSGPFAKSSLLSPLPLADLFLYNKEQTLQLTARGTSTWFNKVMDMADLHLGHQAVVLVV